MQQTDTRSLQQIKRETEETRAGLTETVEQLRASVTATTADLRERISPQAIKTEVSDYFRGRGERMLDGVTTAARRNPMQAVAVGASLAYPLFRLARLVPLPVVMVGAGLFFAGSKAGRDATQKASDFASDLVDEVGRRGHDLGDQVSGSIAAAKGVASDTIDRASGAIDRASGAAASGVNQVRRTAASAGSDVSAGSDQMRDKAASFGSAINDRAQDLKDTAGDMASLAVETSRDFASGVMSSVKNAAGSTADAGRNAARGIQDRASDFSGRAGKTFVGTIEQNPLLVAGVGLFLGGLIASMLPRSTVEDSVIGEASAAVKKRAAEAASQGFDVAKQAVGDIYDTVSRQAGSEGLTPDGLGQTAEDIGQRVRRVAETAVATAFKPQNQVGQDSGGNKNG